MGQNVVDPPRVVVYWTLCKRLHVLPYPGGLLDQPPWVVEGFMICIDAENDAAAHQAKTKGAGKQAGRPGRGR